MAAIPFRRQLAFEYGVSSTLAPDIRRVVANNPSAFTLYGTGSYIVGTGNVAVIDPGPADQAHIDALLKATAGERITHMLVTHTHRDHSPGCRLLASRTDAKTYGYGPHGAGGAGRPDALGPVEEGGDMAFAPDVTLRDGDVVDGDGWSIGCVHTPGHTSNHLCFAFESKAGDRVLFTGDHVMGWSTSVVSPPDGDMASYMASLRLLLDRDDSVYWPTHGPAIEDPKPHVRAFIAHREERERQILDALADGPRRIAELVPGLYADVPGSLHAAAARSVFAAMLLLVERGDVAPEGELTAGASFRLAPGRAVKIAPA